MADENTQSVIILNRQTYDNRKSAGQLLDNVLYIVQEPSLNSKTFLSFYLKDARVTDLISLNDVYNISNETNFTNINVPATLPIADKLYTLIDSDNDVVRIYASDNGNTIPLCGLPIWED